MYPAYRWTDSYPHHPNPIHYDQSDDPKAKEIPSLMKINPSNLNSPYLQWPCGGNYCYPIPQGCHHNCCNHSYSSGPYGFMSPYPHYPPPPPQFHTHGFFPPFPGAYPAYSVPPPHYSIEQPRYDYDKNTLTPRHCCGCNHQQDEKKLRIRQEEPEVENKPNNSLVPFLKDCPYPIMWIPPSYRNTESNSNANEKEEKNSHDPSSLKPLLEPSKLGGNGEIARDQDGDDINNNRFPFPIFWLPSKTHEVGKDIKNDNLDLAAQKGSGNEAVQKVIPVKQMETEVEKKSAIETREKEKEKSDSVKKTDNGKDGKASPMTSKLPPVCLRIDPLPRKKNSSRSPSPPGDKQRSKGPAMDDSKSSKQQTQVSEGLKNSKEEQSKGSIKSIEVTNGAKNVEKDSLVDPCEKGIVQDQSNKMVEASKVEKKKDLSEHEAALIIQSAYRGFEVRKSQPLKKLRQIAEVGKQVVELRNRVQDLESSSTIDEKQKLVIGETIMSLLLKLDTIQGLHPIVRDVRKSVAKELVGLQEKLDSLTFVKPETPSQETISSTEKVNHPEEYDAIQEKSYQTEPESDSKEDGPEACNTNLDPEVELQNEQKTGKINDNQIQTLPVDDTIQEKFDQEQAQPEIEPQVELQSEQNTGELNKNQIQTLVEPEKPLDDAIGEKFDQEQTQSDCSDENLGLDTRRVEDYEVEITDSTHEPHDIKPEGTDEVTYHQLQMVMETKQPVDDVITQEKSDQAQMESGTKVETMESGICEHDEVKAAESEDGGTEAHGMTLKPEMRSESLESHVEHTLETEQPVEQEESIQTQAQFESDVCIDDEVNGVQETEEAVEVDDGGAPPVVGAGDRKLMEENEKLRVAVEELMKAGIEQLDVIRELTGRVKDLEKKLSKKKTKKVKKCRSRGSVVEEELRSCIV